MLSMLSIVRNLRQIGHSIFKHSSPLEIRPEHLLQPAGFRTSDVRSQVSYMSALEIVEKTDAIERAFDF